MTVSSQHFLLEIEILTVTRFEDLIFKNQAISQRDKDNKKSEFVNDLLRTEFHKYVHCIAIFTSGAAPSLPCR